MSAVPTPRLDRAVMRALEVRAMRHEKLAHYLGIEPETLDLALIRLKGRLARQGKLIYPLGTPAVALPEPEEPRAPRPSLPTWARYIGKTQRLILAACATRFHTVQELMPVAVRSSDMTRRAVETLVRRGLLQRRVSRRVSGKVIWTYGLTGKGREVKT